MKNFDGFAPLDANFTSVPNQFFDHILGRYPGPVVTVVGILIRHTLGWVDQHTGGRRVEASLPLRAFIRPELSETSARKGLREAIAAGFIIETAPSSPHSPARYALRWADTAAQKEAIDRQRRAVGDSLPVVVPDPQPPRSATEDVDKKRGSDLRPLNSGGQDSAPLLKKDSPEKKESIDSHSLFARGGDNVQRLTLEQPNKQPDAPPKKEKEPLSMENFLPDQDQDRDAESTFTEKVVDQIIEATGDERSRRRWRQLAGITVEHQDVAAKCWRDMLSALEQKRLSVEAAGGDPKFRPGAYAAATLVRLLRAEGVTVPEAKSPSVKVKERDPDGALRAAAIRRWNEMTYDEQQELDYDARRALGMYGLLTEKQKHTIQEWILKRLGG